MTKEYTITETQYEVLADACSKAENPGACKYSKGCVVAKLCDFYEVSYPPNDDMAIDTTNKADLKYPIPLLLKLQEQWDSYEEGCKDVIQCRVWLLDLLNILLEVKVDPQLVDLEDCENEAST